ncbi:MAG: homoserine dehydrogenase [Bacilli bacterium]|nr:homoserine dehydrogenase [Bacilli bacterium]
MKINVAILGLGTVGYGVYDIITHSTYLKNVKVKKILDKDLSRNEEVGGIITTDYKEILLDKEINVVVETMGAGTFSYKCIKEALMCDKNVITANKEVIADHLDELTKLKNVHKVSLYYEASVGGGIPIIKPLHLLALNNNVNSIQGILNGTTNFILSSMDQNKLSFKEALKLAQEKGFAESDPTNDLEGLDMVRKIAILSMIAYKTNINIKNIYHYGIAGVTPSDIDYARSKGYELKFIASSLVDNGKLSIRVEPTFVKSSSVLSSIDWENNGILVNTNYHGDLLFYGKGAGRYPTAAAIVNDLVMIYSKDKNYSLNVLNKLSFAKNNKPSKYYIRVKNIKKIDQKIIEKIERNVIITKMIDFNDINLDGVSFYARIGD